MKYENKLINSTSPYLLQHVNNPVAWHEWNDATIAKAKELDKPILLSIGYSSCHWCHVMAHESFENEQVAALMNDHFINIKVDREERPDLDHIYMNAIQALTGSGGWPLNVFLTPDLKPFYGGTYFPPRPVGNRPSWPDVLIHMSLAYKNQRVEVEQQANKLLEVISKDSSFTTIESEVNIEQMLFVNNDFDKIFEQMQIRFDQINGGFEQAPKFLGTMILEWLLTYAHFTKNKNALIHVQLTLDKMSKGGLFDQIGGGFARYSTDAEWFAPHFEKMLYDNALMISVLAKQYAVSKNEEIKQTAISTLMYLKNEMQHTNGGFYSALDADSEGIEGKYYVFTKEELKGILTKSEFEVIEKLYNITSDGNWEHQFNILHQFSSINKVAIELELDENELSKILYSAKHKLKFERDKRIRPLTDTKQILSWNALLLSACCQAYYQLGEIEFKNTACKIVQFFEEKFLQKGIEFTNHQVTNDMTQLTAYLDDYAYLMQSFLDYYELTFDEKYLQLSYQIAHHIITNFKKENSPFFYFTSKLQTDVVARIIDLYDGAMPSANSVICRAFIKLALVFNDNDLLYIATHQLTELKGAILQHPTSFSNWALASYELSLGINEITISGKKFSNMPIEVKNKFIPCSFVLQANAQSNIPRLQNYNEMQEGIFVCKNKSCFKPVYTTKDVLQLLN